MLEGKRTSFAIWRPSPSMINKLLREYSSAQ
uniref:Uncharacterized protein n=1 Tax=Anguilla anguilla TaxID=7936 RepID=A0A0E9V1D4_ANGAN